MPDKASLNSRNVKVCDMKALHLTGLMKGLPLACGLLLVATSGSHAQSSDGSEVPIVTVQATQPIATVSNSGVFTVFRAGNTNLALNVWYDLGGTVSNGVDYAAIPPHLVAIDAGAISNTIVITPTTNPPNASAVETVVLTLTNSPLMTPVNYEIGSPSAGTVYIEGKGVTNLPPAVNIVSPASGSRYFAPADISLLARAADPDGPVTNVEFFANDADLGRGQPVVLDPPGANGVTGLVYLFNWQNVPTNNYILTAVATDNGGLSATSAPVKITVQWPPTNLPPVVRITSPPDDAMFFAPVNIPLYAYADADEEASGVIFNGVTNLEFYADGTDLGPARHVMFGPPPPAPGEPTPQWIAVLPNNFFLLWSNAPVGKHSLTAVAENGFGNATTSAPVNISVVSSPPPPTNRPPLVGIVATDPVAIEGTNCWPCLGLTNGTPTWSNWIVAASSASLCPFTNCGPKNATFAVFRSGDTNDDLVVNYYIGGSASNGVDYATLPGEVRIPAGQRRASIAVVPLDDGPPDLNSTVVLKLAPDATGTNYVVGFPASAAAIILDSPSPRAATGVLPGNIFVLKAAGPDGAWFHVECTTDMIHWTPICTNQVVNGEIDFADPDTANQPARFYRVVPEAGPPQ
jgi:hypothetical protein